MFPTSDGSKTGFPEPSLPPPSLDGLLQRRDLKGKEVDTGNATAKSLDGGFNVHLLASKLERVTALNYISSKTAKARLATMTPAELNKLRVFSTFLSPVKTQITLFGKELRRCRFHLVELDSAKYICIEGLSRPADIRRFHQVMSQTRYRSLYHPWKLCYEAQDTL